MNEVVVALGLAVVLLIGVPVLRLIVPFRLADALAGQPGSVRWFVVVRRVRDRRSTGAIG